MGRVMFHPCGTVIPRRCIGFTLYSITPDLELQTASAKAFFRRGPDYTLSSWKGPAPI